MLNNIANNGANNNPINNTADPLPHVADDDLMNDQKNNLVNLQIDNAAEIINEPIDNEIAHVTNTTNNTNKQINNLMNNEIDHPINDKSINIPTTTTEIYYPITKQPISYIEPNTPINPPIDLLPLSPSLTIPPSPIVPRLPLSLFVPPSPVIPKKLFKTTPNIPKKLETISNNIQWNFPQFSAKYICKPAPARIINTKVIKKENICKPAPAINQPTTPAINQPTAKYICKPAPTMNQPTAIHNTTFINPFISSSLPQKTPIKVYVAFPAPKQYRSKMYQIFIIIASILIGVSLCVFLKYYFEIHTKSHLLYSAIFGTIVMLLWSLCYYNEHKTFELLLNQTYSIISELRLNYNFIQINQIKALINLNQNYICCKKHWTEIERVLDTDSRLQKSMKCIGGKAEKCVALKQ